MNHRVIISGSHGSVVADRRTGYIIDRPEGCDCGECLNGYGNIAYFDPFVFERDAEFTHFDVLATAYVETSGLYVEAWTVRTAEETHNGETFEEFDEWVPFALLPAPKGTFTAAGQSAGATNGTP